MNWDLAQLMKEALEANKDIFKSALRDDPEAIKNLDPDPNIGKYIRDSLHKVTGITIHDSIPRAQFDEWKNSNLDASSLQRNGMHKLSSNYINSEGSFSRSRPHGMSISLDGNDEEIAESSFYISYPVLDGNILKTLGEVHVVSPIIGRDSRGLGLGTFLYMVIMWTCYKRYGVKYAATHAATFTGGTSESADRVYNSLKMAGVLSPVRDLDNHKEYLSAIGKDELRAERLLVHHGTGLPIEKEERLSYIEKELEDIWIKGRTKEKDKIILENAIKIIENPEEHNYYNLKYFYDAEWVSKNKTKEYIESALKEINQVSLAEMKDRVEILEEEKKEIEKERKSELSPEEVIHSIEKEKEFYKDYLNNNFVLGSEGDGMDHYQINHNALINYFKMFADHHPELCNEDGNLNIKYNNAQINIV